MTGIILDSVVIVLLMVTIAFAVRLNSRLKLIKNHRQDFADDIKKFTDATEAAVVAVEELHVKGEEICKRIDDKIRRAEMVCSELEFLTDRANARVAVIKQAQMLAKQAEAPKRPELSYSSVNSIAEAQLLKVMRDREFKEALNS